jgi:hypothetical protein
MATPQPSSDETLPDPTASLDTTDSVTPLPTPPPSPTVDQQQQRPSIDATLGNAMKDTAELQASANNGSGNEQDRSPTVTDDNPIAANASNNTQGELNLWIETPDAVNTTFSTDHHTNDTTDEEYKSALHSAIDLEGHSSVPNHYRHPAPTTSQFMEYNYPLHLQPPDLDENLNWTESAEQATSVPVTSLTEKYEPSKPQDIKDLTASIYPHNATNSDMVPSIKVM